MPAIRPVSDLQDNIPEIEEICIKEQRPVFITKNGSEYLVIMSQKLYEEQLRLMELYDKLDEAEAQSAAGIKRIPHHEVIAKLKERVYGQI